jgi:hypothetical protein
MESGNWNFFFSRTREVWIDDGLTLKKRAISFVSRFKRIQEQCFISLIDKVLQYDFNLTTKSG